MKFSKITLLFSICLLVAFGCSDSNEKKKNVPKTTANKKAVKKDGKKKENTFEKVLKIPRAKEQTQFWVQSIDGKILAKMNDPSKVTLSGKDVHITGWAFDKPNNKLAGGVYLRLNGKVYRCSYSSDSKQVADKYGKHLLKSRFSKKLSIKDFKKGENKLEVIVLSNDKSKAYRHKHPLLKKDVYIMTLLKS